MRRLRLLLPAARRLRDAPGAVVHPTPVPSPPPRLLSHSSGRGRLAQGAESLAPDHWPPTTPTLARYEIGASTRHRRPHLAARRRHCHGEGAAGGRDVQARHTGTRRFRRGGEEDGETAADNQEGHTKTSLTGEEGDKKHTSPRKGTTNRKQTVDKHRDKESLPW